MNGRGRAAVAFAALVAVVSMIAIPQSAIGAEEPHQPAPAKRGSALISFALPTSSTASISPNALNYAKSGRPGSPLLLFLPATGAVPAHYQQFLSTASSLGFHVLALDYWNRGMSVVRTCAGDALCYTAVQENRFNGSHPTSFSAIAPQDSILNRLRAAIGYLSRSDPGGDWAEYSTKGKIDWSRIVLAGHSQGGGESAFIAHGHDVHGVLMFSSPVESDDGIAASWMATPGKTPTSSMYGLVNKNDIYFQHVVGSWAALGLGTPVDSNGLPAGNKAHVIVNTLNLGTPEQSHGRSVSDSTPDNAAGVPLLKPVWTWMLKQVL
jgi:pimeloyl-ACP methyl ester carboxylesterase